MVVSGSMYTEGLSSFVVYNYVCMHVYEEFMYVHAYVCRLCKYVDVGTDHCYESAHAPTYTRIKYCMHTHILTHTDTHKHAHTCTHTNMYCSVTIHQNNYIIVTVYTYYAQIVDTLLILMCAHTC